MTLPGFNAETALYKTSADYRSRVTAVGLAGVVPQLDPRGTHCGPCIFGWQSCYNCLIEGGRCFSWTQRCPQRFYPEPVAVP
jgi:hypothetical protein